jgi:hypothetical protein
MSTHSRRYDRINTALTAWMARNGIRFLRIRLGVVFVWFGVLAFFPGLSPAQTPAGETIAAPALELPPGSPDSSALRRPGRGVDRNGTPRRLNLSGILSMCPLILPALPPTILQLWRTP